MHNEEVSVDGDQEDGEGGEENTGGLGGSHHFTDYLLRILSN